MKNLTSKLDNVPLKHKLVLLILITILIPIMAVTVSLSVYIKNAMFGQAVTSVESAVSQITGIIDEMIKGQSYNVSETIMNDKELYGMLTREYGATRFQKQLDARQMAQKMAADYDRVYREISIAAVYGTNGECFNLADPFNQSDEITKQVSGIANEIRRNGYNASWYSLRDDFFSYRKESELRHSKVVLCAMNLFIPTTGEYVGVQLLAIQEQFLFEKYRDTNLSKDGNVFIIDSQGGLVSASSEEYLADAELIDAELISHVSNDAEQTFIWADDSLVTSAVSSINGWRTVGLMPLNTVTGPADDIFKLFSAVIVACVIICLLFVIIVATNIVRPIDKIINSMRAFEQGNLKSFVKIQGRNELGVLGGYYNRMIERINFNIIDKYEDERQKKQLELNVLTSQINSHFLANTLETIVLQARAANAYDVSKMASSLGKYFRASIGKKGVFTSVSNEIEHVTAYVNIQKIRYGDKFSFTLTKEDAEDGSNITTLKTVIQPLVENAITHGMEGLSRVMEINVKISVWDGLLVYEVHDNGRGIPADKLDMINNGSFESEKPGRNIGLKNIRERIKLYYGTECPAAGLTMESVEGEGTKMVVTMPARDIRLQ